MTRGNNFDALRLIGALAVLVSHQFALMRLPEPEIGGYTLGTIAVFIFFAISGYLVAGSWQSDPDPVRYLKRRALRMAPGWAVLMVLSALVMLAMGSRFFENNPVPNFNGSLWTLEWEILCYVVLGVASLLLPLRVVAPLGLAVLLVARLYADVPAYSEMMAMFFAGAALRAWKTDGRVVVFAALTAVTFSAMHQPFYSLLVLIPVASIHMGCASWPYLRRAGRFGDFSYGIYIYAYPVQQLFIMWLGWKGQPYLPMLALSVAVTLALAALSWHLVEAPALRWKPRKPTHGVTAAYRLAASPAEGA